MENETRDLAPDTLHLYQFLTPRIFFRFWVDGMANCNLSLDLFNNSFN